MTLHELIHRIPNVRLVGNEKREITGIAYDSRAVRPGDLFCALPGAKVDGNRFIPTALDNGAAAVLTETLDAVPDNVPAVLARDARQAMALASHVLYGGLTESLITLGITGTNGKTTCAHILQSIATAAGHPCGRIGTNGWNIADHGKPLERTTPEAPDLLALLDRMHGLGAEAVAMEVTSIAVPMRRVDGFLWDGVLFTNLSQDHLDLHKTMEAYFAAKHDFFRQAPAEAVAVANLDDEHGAKMLEGIHARPVSFGFTSEADVRGEIVDENAAGMTLRVTGRFGEHQLRTPYIGRFNASNVLGCATLGLALGWDPDAIARGVEQAPQVRGRMERLALQGGVTAVIDYAHTPDALERALEALRPMASGRLIVVIGAGGDRDSTKRPVMGRVASEGADVAIYTSDNPRTEDPETIVRQVAAGAVHEQVEVVVDRRNAIRKALDLAQDGDVVLVAGKGHETYQEVHGVKHPFDDREEVLKLRGRAS